MKVSTLARRKGSKSLKACNTYGNNGSKSHIRFNTYAQHRCHTTCGPCLSTRLARVSSSTDEIRVAVHRSERLDVRLEGQAAGGGAGSASGGEQSVVVTLS